MSPDFDVQKSLPRPSRLCIPQQGSPVPHPILQAAWLSALAVAMPAALPAQQLSLDSMLAATAARITAACPISGEPDALLRHESRLARYATERHTDSLAPLACVRAHLYRTGTIARASWNQPEGEGWHEGAVRTATHALDAGTDRGTIAELLGALLLAEPSVDSPQVAVTALARLARTGSALPVSAVRGCVREARRLARLDLAEECAGSQLHRGQDSTWLLLELAWSAAAQGEASDAARYVDLALDAAHRPDDWESVGWHLGWFLTDEEREQWAGRPDSTRRTWVRERLAARDIRDGRPLGSRILEHFRRLTVADSAFRSPIPTRDLGRFRLAAAPETPPEPPQFSRGRSAPVSSLRTTEAWYDPALVAAAPFREYQRYDPRYDDRAVPYVRLGEPTARIRWVGRDSTRALGRRNPIPLRYPNATNTREAWRYDLDGRTLLLHFESERFSGTTDATRLVTGVLGHYLCDVDAVRCALSARSQAAFDAVFRGNAGEGAPVTPEQIAALRTADADALREATTRDDFSVRARRSIAMVSQVHRVWRSQAGDVVVIVPYALRMKDIASSGASTTTIDLEVHHWDPETATSGTHRTSRNVRLPAAREADSYLTGVLVVDGAPSAPTWSVIATQGDSVWGRAAADFLPPLADAPLAISDVVIGAASQGQSWQSPGGETIPLAPLGALDRREPVSLFWQVRSRSTRDSLRTTVAFIRTTARGDETALQVSFVGRSSAGIVEATRELDVSRLDAGTYRLELTVHDRREDLTVRRSSRLLLR